MYYFIEPKDRHTYNHFKKHFGHSETSDLSMNPEGWVLTEKQIKELPDYSVYNIYEIPPMYQDDIDSFKEDYWDGDFMFDIPQHFVY